MTKGPYPAAKPAYASLATARPKLDTEKEEEAYDDERSKLLNPFDGLVHYPDGTRKTWDTDDVVDGVNNYMQKPSLKAMKQNPYTGNYVDDEGKVWFADDEQAEVSGVNNWA